MVERRGNQQKGGSRGTSQSQKGSRGPSPSQRSGAARKDGKAAELGRKEPAGPGASPEDSAPGPVGGTAEATVGGQLKGLPAGVSSARGGPSNAGEAGGGQTFAHPKGVDSLSTTTAAAGLPVGPSRRPETQLGTASGLPLVAFPPSQVVVPPGPSGDGGAAPVAPSFPALMPTKQQKFSIPVAVVPHVEEGSASVSFASVRDDWEEAIAEPIGVFPPTEAKQAAGHPQPNIERGVVSTQAALSR
ncbi:hypothetical protein CBR_g41162 [Chara braunii]|uniref:Uncharacterized protein n=1 Tax=Chara braunii TaxID=69332 RepID=A0A388K2F4_CHABU|nr:hypothetical protein CBR_g41162 [Chara braunii]|eukprot:GBG64241.1 hypothetical protein CBR_g41162 [Chara braunii]